MTIATAAPYYVNRLVYALRAEGHFMGTPMVAISLADPQVDGHELEGNRVMSASELAEEALRVLAVKFRRCGVAHNEPYPARGAWCYLGGDGARHAELPAIVEALQDIGFYVAIETDANATNWLDAGIDWVCIAPNFLGNNPDANREAMALADELRFLIYAPADIDFTIAFCAEYPVAEGRARVVSVQPVGELNVPARNACISQGLAHGWRVSFMAYPDPRETIRLDVDPQTLARATEEVLKSRNRRALLQ